MRDEDREAHVRLDAAKAAAVSPNAVLRRVSEKCTRCPLVTAKRVPIEGKQSVSSDREDRIDALIALDKITRLPSSRIGCNRCRQTGFAAVFRREPQMHDMAQPDLRRDRLQRLAEFLLVVAESVDTAEIHCRNRGFH